MSIEPIQFNMYTPTQNFSMEEDTSSIADDTAIDTPQYDFPQFFNKFTGMTLQNALDSIVSQLGQVDPSVSKRTQDLDIPRYVPYTSGGKIARAFTEKYGERPAGNVRATRRDLGISGNETFVIDVGGEGQKEYELHDIDIDHDHLVRTTGNINAVNVNWPKHLNYDPGFNPTTYTIDTRGKKVVVDGESQHNNAPIYNRVGTSSPWNQEPSLPFADNSVDGAIMQYPSIKKSLAKSIQDTLQVLKKNGGFLYFQVDHTLTPDVNEWINNQLAKEMERRLGAKAIVVQDYVAPKSHKSPGKDGAVLFVPKSYNGKDPKTWRAHDGTKGVDAHHFYEFVNEQKNNVGNEPSGELPGEPVRSDLEDTQTPFNTIYSPKFYEDTRNHMDHIRQKWDEWARWKGNDDIVSESDLEKLKETDKHAKWLYNRRDFRDYLDVIRGGRYDKKFSTKDWNKWFDTIKVPHMDKKDTNGPKFGPRFYKDNLSAFDSLRNQFRLWALWVGNDNKISRHDLENEIYMKDDPLAKWLTAEENEEFFDDLDAAKTGKKNGKFSDDDLSLFFRSVGAHEISIDYVPPRFYKDFYNKNIEHFEAFRNNWKAWADSHRMISWNDLFNKPLVKDERAVKWLRNNLTFFDYLESLKNGKFDQRISNEDLKLYFKKLGVPTNIND